MQKFVESILDFFIGETVNGIDKAAREARVNRIIRIIFYGLAILAFLFWKIGGINGIKEFWENCCNPDE